MNIIKNCFFYFVTFISWISSPKNRKIAYKYYKMGQCICNMRKNYKKDESGLKFIAQTFFEVCESLDEKDTEEIAKKIHQDTGKLNDISIDYDIKKQKANLNLFGLNLGYSPRDGAASFSYKVNF